MINSCLLKRNIPVIFVIFVIGIFTTLTFLPGKKDLAKATSLQASLVNTIDTSLWSPNSPDPAGLEYLASSNTLIVSDSEVEEMPAYFQGLNVFESSLDGTLENTYSTTLFSNEPTGVAVNPTNGHLFFSDDNKKKVFEVDQGADKIFGTSDDTVTSFSTSSFNSNDPEGVAFGGGKLFIADGVGTQVYVVDPGVNGIFDGVSPSGDDQVTNFDTSNMTQPDPEGIAYNTDNNTLYIVSNNGGKLDNRITETTTTGSVVNVIDISFLGARSTAGLAYGPGSANPVVKNIYIAARGVDNDQNSNENDGKIYEITLTSMPSPTPTPTETPGPSPTSTPNPSELPEPSPIPANLLSNGGFELDANNDGKPDSWSSKKFFTRSSEDVVGGTYAGRHLSTSNSGYTISQLVSGIIPSRSYNFSGWTNIPPTTDSFTYRLQVRWLNSSGNTISTKTIKKYTVQTSGWDQASANLVAPASATTAIIRMSVGSLNARIYADEFSFFANDSVNNLD